MTGETLRYLAIEFGPAFYLVVLYSYPLVTVSALLFLRRFFARNEPRRYRYQALALFGAHLPPLFFNLLYLSEIVPRDFTVVGFATTGAMITAAIYRYDLLDIAPIARSTVVENMDGGVIVIDSEDTVADLNPRAAKVLDVSALEAIGREVETVFASFPSLLERFGDEYDTREQITLEGDDWVRHVDVDITPLRDADRTIGRVAVFRDVTEQERIRRELKQRRAELERQNERLEDFARIVTHDLRNPLTVAKGRLDLIREETASEHVDRTAEALDRMEALVEDVRTMAAQGQAVRETETVSLRTTAKEAWRSVATADATLDVTTNATIDASRSGLLQLYENLFRNAIEHGRTDVRVTVGDLDDGFFVADDGPGIPEDERDEVMEDGYTTTTDGTGLGLPIVRTIADAHGWTVDVTESTDGGARFEIRSIEDVSGTDRPTDSAADGQAPGV